MLWSQHCATSFPIGTQAHHRLIGHLVPRRLRMIWPTKGLESKWRMHKLELCWWWHTQLKWRHKFYKTTPHNNFLYQYQFSSGSYDMWILYYQVVARWRTCQIEEVIVDAGFGTTRCIRYRCLDTSYPRCSFPSHFSCSYTFLTQHKEKSNWNGWWHWGW